MHRDYRVVIVTETKKEKQEEKKTTESDQTPTNENDIQLVFGDSVNTKESFGS